MDGRASIRVSVEGWEEDRDEAEQWFKRWCNIEEPGLQRFEMHP